METQLSAPSVDRFGKILADEPVGGLVYNSIGGDGVICAVAVAVNVGRTIVVRRVVRSRRWRNLCWVWAVVRCGFSLWSK